MKPKRILVTGPSGSGKTYFAGELRKMGYHAFDADAVDGLADWTTAMGKKVVQPKKLSKKFIISHRFLWDRAKLMKLFDSNSNLILFGISHNSNELGRLFDSIYLLKVPIEQIIDNLDAESRLNSFGHQREHLDMVRKDTEEFYMSAPKNWQVITATNPKELVSLIGAVK